MPHDPVGRSDRLFLVCTGEQHKIICFAKLWRQAATHEWITPKGTDDERYSLRELFQFLFLHLYYEGSQTDVRCFGCFPCDYSARHGCGTCFGKQSRKEKRFSRGDHRCRRWVTDPVYRCPVSAADLFGRCFRRDRWGFYRTPCLRHSGRQHDVCAI